MAAVTSGQGRTCRGSERAADGRGRDREVDPGTPPSKDFLPQSGPAAAGMFPVP